MKRLLVFALVATVANASVAFAGESILTSGARHAQRLAVAESATTPATSASSLPGRVVVPVGAKAVAPSFQEQAGNLSRSGMSRGMKVLMFIGIGVGFAASAYAIDHHVVDNTPSSLGTRQD